MNKTKMSLATIAICLLVLMTVNAGVVYGDSSGESEGSVSILSANPSMAGPELWDSGEAQDKNNTALTVNTEYHLNFTISDDNTLADLDNVTLRVWDTSSAATENDTDAEQNHYTFRWYEANDTWTSSPSGFVNTGNCKDPGTGSSETQYEFTCAFDLGKAAGYTANTDDWNISIFVWDDNNDFDAERSIVFGVAFYSEISVTDSTHTWGNLNPGDTDQTITDSPLNFDVIANAAWDVQAQANQSALVSGSNQIGIGNITIHKDTVGSSVSLTTSWTDIVGLTSQTASTEEASATSTYCTLWLDVPTGTPVGDYKYKLELQVIQA